jgi:hypothetical protein
MFSVFYGKNLRAISLIFGQLKLAGVCPFCDCCCGVTSVISTAQRNKPTLVE